MGPGRLNSAESGESAVDGSSSAGLGTCCCFKEKEVRAGEVKAPATVVVATSTSERSRHRRRGCQTPPRARPLAEQPQAQTHGAALPHTRSVLFSFGTEPPGGSGHEHPPVSPSTPSPRPGHRQARSPRPPLLRPPPCRRRSQGAWCEDRCVPSHSLGLYYLPSPLSPSSP